MIPTKREQHELPTTEVVGDFPVYWLHTSGDVNEKFFMGLKEQKILGNTCNNCSYTYLPPKMFCEDCFEELGEDTYKELGTTAELYSFSEVYLDKAGKDMKPQTIGLFRVDGSNTYFFHKLLNTSNPSIGMKVQAVWAENRVGSLLDLAGFES